MKVIDVSQFNGSIVWDKVKDACDGAILRVGYRGYGSNGRLVTDTLFRSHIIIASTVGVPLGVYFVTQAINEAEARQEARYTLELVKGYKLLYPIFIDSENGSPKGTGRADRGKLTKAQRTAILKAFCEEIEANGYKAGVYASESWFRDELNRSELEKFYLWVAKYSSNAPNIKYDAWQYTSRGRVNGVTGYVDLSNFLKLIDNKKDDAATTTPTTDKLSNEEIAEEVIAGKWGNEEDRKARLKAAGYDYNAVQDIVNAKLKAKANNSAVYYTVKRGDTLSGIAVKYGTTVNKLVSL